VDGVSSGLLGGLAYILIRGTINKINGWLKYAVLYLLVFFMFLVGTSWLSGNVFSFEGLYSIRFWAWVTIIYAVLAFYESVPYLDKKLNDKD